MTMTLRGEQPLDEASARVLAYLGLDSDPPADDVELDESEALSEVFFFGGANYRRSEEAHQIITMVGRPYSGGADRIFGVMVQYSLNSNTGRRAVPKRRQNEAQILEALALYDKPCAFTVYANLVIPLTDPSQLWFPLPSRFGSGSSRAAAYDIQGIEGVRRAPDDDQALFSFEMRLGEKNNLELDLEFKTELPLEPDMPAIAFQFARRFANDLTRV